jgi:hypothetical protein
MRKMIAKMLACDSLSHPVDEFLEAVLAEIASTLVAAKER